MYVKVFINGEVRHIHEGDIIEFIAPNTLLINDESFELD